MSNTQVKLHPFLGDPFPTKNQSKCGKLNDEWTPYAQVRSKAAEDSRAAAVAAASRPEDEEKVAASMRLAYQDLGAQQKKAVSE